MRLRAAPQHLAGLACYAVLTVVLTWPVLRDITRVVPNDLGDPLLSTFLLWWNAQVLPFTERWWQGPFFFPAPDTLTYSDHRVGIGLITTPALWFGASPLAAQNFAFVLTFFLSAAAAYALCFVLTGSRAAAFVGGLVFGFNPYRADHLSHLELLASYWLPIVLLGLHQWIATRRLRWLSLTGVSLVLLALTSGYYFIFSSVLLALWIGWFVPHDGRPAVHGWTFATLALSAAVVAPVFLKYRAAHDALDLRRGLAEIEYYSADLIALVTAPERLVLWDTPASWYRAEGALFPGVTVVLLVAAALWIRRKQPAPAPGSWARRGRIAALALALIMTGVALVPIAFGPVAEEVAGLRISISDSHKPFSVAVVFFSVWLLTSAAVQGAWHRRSTFGFYVLATVIMWVFALGPAPKLFGELILYKPPYAWLMELPGFGGGLRVPARFGMLAAFTLSVAAALAFERLLRDRPRPSRLATAALLGIAVMAESWFELPAPPPPAALEIPRELPADAVVLELPMGIAEDAAAMYRAIAHRRPVVNGMSGHDAPHYRILRQAWEEGRFEAVGPLAAYAPIAIFIDRGAIPPDVRQQIVTRMRALPVAATAKHDVFLMPRSGRGASDDAVRGAAVRSISASTEPSAAAAMLDDDRETVWMTSTPQIGGEHITIELQESVEVAGLRLRQGIARFEFPRELTIDVSPDGNAWTETWRDQIAASMVAATLENPRDPAIRIDFAPAPARFVRVRQLGQSRLPWAMAELEVLALAR